MLHILPSGTHITLPETPDPAATPQLVEQLCGGMTFQVPCIMARKCQYANVTGKCNKLTNREYFVSTNRIRVFSHLFYIGAIGATN